MASDDSTVLVLSTHSGITLCRFKAHSPILSLAWVRDSKGFFFGCKNGMLASADITELQHYVKTTFFKEHIKSWELKVKLPPPSTIDFCREVEVTSVNWENQNAATVASFTVVSYKWHGIMCWDVMNLTVLWQLPMEDCSSLSLSPDSRFMAMYGLSNAFKVQDLKLGTVQSLQWKAPMGHPKVAKNRPVCFTHEGFAVAGAMSDTKVLVWDTECGDQLLSLSHGNIIEGSKVCALAMAFLKEEDQFLITTCAEKQGKFHVFLWATTLSSLKAPSTLAAYIVGGNRNEIFMQSFWINVALLAILVFLLSWWMMHLYANVTVTAVAYLVKYMGTIQLNGVLKIGKTKHVSKGKDEGTSKHGTGFLAGASHHLQVHDIVDIAVLALSHSCASSCSLISLRVRCNIVLEVTNFFTEFYILGLPPRRQPLFQLLFYAQKKVMAVGEGVEAMEVACALHRPCCTLVGLLCADESQSRQKNRVTDKLELDLPFKDSGGNAARDISKVSVSYALYVEVIVQGLEVAELYSVPSLHRRLLRTIRPPSPTISTKLQWESQWASPATPFVQLGKRNAEQGRSDKSFSQHLAVEQPTSIWGGRPLWRDMDGGPSKQSFSIGVLKRHDLVQINKGMAAVACYIGDTLACMRPFLISLLNFSFWPQYDSTKSCYDIET
ncbi:hypothetical protein EI94DRAFT_1705554 [Lactarius quietus]|nr:hypothetical protein EI94DRAFT_1705554 [Lactarius quietus]